MSANLVRLLCGIFASMLLGYLVRPCCNLLNPPQVAVSGAGGGVADSAQQPTTAVAADVATELPAEPDLPVQEIDKALTTTGNDKEDGLYYEEEDEEEVGDTGEDWTVARDSDSFTPQKTPPPSLKPIAEANVPEIPAEQKVPAACTLGMQKALYRKADNLADKYTKALKKQKEGVGYLSKDLSAEAWQKPNEIYASLLRKLLPGLASEKKRYATLQEPQNQLDLARLTLIRKVGYEGIADVLEDKMGGQMLAALAGDLDWINGFLFSGPLVKPERALKYLTAIYAKYPEQMKNSPHTRRIATATALEFAREGWSEQDMLSRFEYYHTSFEEGKLNVIFGTLDYWDTRIVTGCTEPSGWGSVRSLTWQRDNVRLPAEGYLSACNQLVYRLRNVAGDSVFSADYLAPILDYTNHTTAWAHREIGGVCGACSHYGAYGALAAGIPAMTMGEPGHCAYTVRVGNEWKMSYSIYWQHSMHKTFWGLHDWDFLMLTQALYSDGSRQLVSAQLLAAAELLATRKMMKSAFSCYDAALAAQPLNWNVLVSYAGYLKQKAPEHTARWKSLHDHVVNNMAITYHNAAATYLTAYVYPHLLPQVPERAKRNKMYAAFFDRCNSFGTNRWDIAPLLNAQIEGCTTPKEKLAYMKDSLKVLMGKPDYAGAVLTWGLDYVSRLAEAAPTEENIKLHKQFSDLIVKAMGRARADKKHAAATWATLSEAIYAAASNNDKLTFQAIGRLAMRKCRKNFPKQKMRFKRFPGRIVSAKGLIRTATTIDPGQMTQCCLHWAVLQKNGGAIPAKFEGEAGMTVELESHSRVNGVVCVFAEKVKNDRDFILQVSDDGQNWQSTEAVPVIAGNVVRVDLRKEKTDADYVRLLRDGDKWESTINGFYVYGKPSRAVKK
ncbi:MAG: discoidin domain-containing protein [Akkermansiaceae bacterium]|nr:discoidin domain-containing protein [Akkermansiaceae bacterium]